MRVEGGAVCAVPFSVRPSRVLDEFSLSVCLCPWPRLRLRLRLRLGILSSIFALFLARALSLLISLTYPSGTVRDVTVLCHHHRRPAVPDIEGDCVDVGQLEEGLGGRLALRRHGQLQKWEMPVRENRREAQRASKCAHTAMQMGGAVTSRASPVPSPGSFQAALSCPVRGARRKPLRRLQQAVHTICPMHAGNCRSDSAGSRANSESPTPFGTSALLPVPDAAAIDVSRTDE